MKFRDKYGNVFNDIETARRQICIENTCRKCVVAKENNGHYVSCFELMQRQPMEAACLMGYEVIEDGKDVNAPTNMDKLNRDSQSINLVSEVSKFSLRDKPLKDWTLGEIKEFCESKAPYSEDTCEKCVLAKVCARTPDEWNLEERTVYTPSFFQNKDCKYFPCHKINDERDFNCMFCYCPLYHMEKCGGNYSYTDGGIKDCSKCVYPHKRDNYLEIIGLIGSMR